MTEVNEGVAVIEEGRDLESSTEEGLCCWGMILYFY